LRQRSWATGMALPLISLTSLHVPSDLPSRADVGPVALRAGGRGSRRHHRVRVAQCDATGRLPRRVGLPGRGSAYLRGPRPRVCPDSPWPCPLCQERGHMGVVVRKSGEGAAGRTLSCRSRLRLGPRISVSAPVMTHRNAMAKASADHPSVRVPPPLPSLHSTALGALASPPPSHPRPFPQRAL